MGLRGRCPTGHRFASSDPRTINPYEFVFENPMERGDPAGTDPGQEGPLIIDNEFGNLRPRSGRRLLNIGRGSGPGVCEICLPSPSPVATYDGTILAPSCAGKGELSPGTPDQGTRLAVQVSSIPAGTVLLVPTQLNLINSIDMEFGTGGGSRASGLCVHNTELSINNPQQIVAFVQRGLIGLGPTTNFGYLVQRTKLFSVPHDECSERPGPAGDLYPYVHFYRGVRVIVESEKYIGKHHSAGLSPYALRSGTAIQTTPLRNLLLIDYLL